MSTSQPSAAAPDSRTVAPRRHWFRLGCLTVIALLIVAVIVVPLDIYRRLKTTPEHWNHYQKLLEQTTPQERQQIADNVEARFLAALSIRTAGDQPIGDGDGLGLRTFSLSTDEANCWLESKMPQWWANQQAQGDLPPLLREITQPNIAVDDGQLVFSFRYTSPRLNQVVSLYCDLAVPKEGELQLQVRRVVGGTMPVPAQTILSRFTDADDPHGSQVAQQLQSALDGKTYAAKQIMPGNRIGRIKDLNLRPDGLDVTINIVPRDHPGT